MTEPNSEAARFLQTLAPDGVLTFLTLDDSPAKRPGLVRVVHGQYPQIADKLAALHDNGASVFVMANRGDGKGRKAENVLAVRALFVDLDGAPLAPVLEGPIPPRIIVQSSPGKWHCYWPATGVPLAAFSHAQKALARMFAADPMVADLPRVMRVPGYLHRKGGPFRSTLERCDAGEPFHWCDLASAFAFDAPAVATVRKPWQLPGTIPEGERNRELFKMAKRWRRRATSREQAERDLATVNRNLCRPPLDRAEVAGIVASAWSADLHGSAPIPLSVVTSAEFLALRDPAKTLTLAAYVMADPEHCVMLTAATLRDWGLKRQAVTKARREAVTAGFLELHQPPSFGQRGGKRRCAIYRLVRKRA